MNRAGAFFFTFILLATGFTAWAGQTGLADHIRKLAEEYKAQIRLARTDQALGVALGKCGETWLAVAGSLERKVKDPGPRLFLGRAEKDYQKRLAKSREPQNVQLAGLNLLYQSLDTAAFILAKRNRDEFALNEIKIAEERVREVVSQTETGRGGPALAALSGGALAMLAVTAGQLDQKGEMAGVLTAELARRRAIDANIAQSKDVGPEERILLLINNHLYGALSMVQIIGLVQAPGLRSRLRKVEEGLVKVKDAGLESQVLAGAKALAEAGFIVGPVFESITLADESGRKTPE